MTRNSRQRSSRSNPTVMFDNTEEQLMRIEQIEIKNYRSFRHAVFEDLPPMVVVVGANGTGKSTLLDVFSFLKDALTQNVAMEVAEPSG